jgi:2-haloacid dehalogenase
VVSQDVRAYKPDTAPFERALRNLRVSPRETLHVSSDFEYDVAVAKSKGMTAAWVNRHRRQAPGENRPDHEWDSLWSLAEFVGQPPT